VFILHYLVQNCRGGSFSRAQFSQNSRASVLYQTARGRYRHSISVNRKCASARHCRHRHSIFL